MKGFFKKVIFVYLFLKVFGKRHAHFLISGFVVGFFTTLLLIKFYPVVKTAVSPNKKIIGVTGSYQTQNLPLSILKLISSGLTKVTDDGYPSPMLAASWEATDSGKEYIFHLKPHLLWQDGKLLTAQDIKYHLKDAKISVVDDLTVKIKLNEPFSPLPAVLSRPILRDNLTGIGLYKVTNLKYKGEYISNMTLSPLRENLPVLEYKFYPTIDEAVLAYKLGEVNTLLQMPSKETFANWKNTKITEITMYDRFLGIFFNTKDDLLKDKESRQALSFAVPNFADMERVYTPLSPSSWAYYNKVRIYKYDPDNAKKILEKTALSTSSAELTLSTYAVYLPIAQKIADSWNAIGVRTKIKVETSLPDQYQALLVSQEIPSDPDQYQFWHSKETESNLAHYTSLKIDKLLEDGRKTTDEDKRRKIYADFQRYLVDDAPLAFLFFPKVYTIERK